jgi:gas vesicle protein
MNNDNQSTLLSFLIGAAAGVAAGMLLAPYSGTESRKKIAQSANDLAGKVGTQWGDTAEKLSGYVDSAVTAVTGAVNKVNPGKSTASTGTTNTTNTPGGTGTTQY